MKLKHNENQQLSAHFKASEFRCKCGGTHDFEIAAQLIDKLEALRTRLCCSRIDISSGYRCSKHDKAVGGKGNGQHTLGKAADVICYDAEGKVIASELVCCAAQDIGFTGIARINTRGYTHVDVRDGHWFGDETISSTKTATDDFYKYFGITKPERTVLRKGDTGDDVLHLQGVLAGLGYYGGELDGKYGKQTMSAVCGFQLDERMEIDGICGPKTRAALSL